MTNTTIAISKETKAKLQEFSTKGEKYDDVINRLYESAKERLLHDILMSEEGTVTIEEAMTEARKKWSK
ncbi:hypothetical protein K9L97_04675 [Candidatus Woesearchaeota archaeon]|nr:hypothetical protein [Candidatus Woesearchaeota archaeon]